MSGSSSNLVADEFVAVELTQVRVGSTLHTPLYDGGGDNQQLLLSAGTEVTAGHLHSLRRRGITQVLIHRDDFERVAVPSSSLNPQQLEHNIRNTIRGGESFWETTTDSFVRKLQSPAEAVPSEDTLTRLANQRENQTEVTANIFHQMITEGDVDVPQVRGITLEQLEAISLDIDAYLGIGLEPIKTDYPSRHSVQTAMLATSMGTLMGLKPEDLQELAMGCLLHEAGMLMLPAKLRDGHFHGLSATDRLEVMKHPVHVANLLSKRTDIPIGTRMVAYQMHERMNGSGYPRKRVGQQIHLYARIGALADTYLTMISPRGDHQPLKPYRAMERLLFATQKRLFDPSALRALLYSVSLFPIGSLVVLNDQRVARVVRSNRDQFAQPILQTVDPETGKANASSQIIDLSKSIELSVETVL